MKHVIGKFGAGAKAGLATGVEYFVVETIYNGFKTSFMIFRRDYDPITPQHSNGKEEIWKVRMEDGTEKLKTIYWEPTTESNGVSVSLEVKKHNKDAFIDAVRSQFQYFSGKVHLTITNEEGVHTIDPLNEKPLYESDTLLIPKYSTYTTPHILVDGISYGVINWPELELDRRQGRIAMKVPATAVDITQSRESLKWTEKTKKTVLSVVEKARDEASDYMTNRLALVDDQNIFHLNRLYSNMHTRDGDSVDNVFKKFLDIGHIKAKFTLKGSFGSVESRMGFNLFEFLFYSFTVKKVHTYSEDGKIKIRTEKVESFSAMGDAKIIYAAHSTLGPRLAVHLLNKYDVGHFLYIRQNPTKTKSVLELQKVEYPTSKVDDYTIDLLEKYSDLNLDKYEVVYDESEDDLESEIKQTKDTSLLGIEARVRKANKEVLYMRFYDHYGLFGDYGDITYKREKHTVRINDIKHEFSKDVIIVPGKFSELGKLVELASLLTTGKTPTNVIYVSQEVVKHFLPYGILITDYFRQLNTKTGELMIGEHIRNLNTLRIFRELLDAHSSFSENNAVIKTLTDINYDQYNELRRSSQSNDPQSIIMSNGNLKDEMVAEVFGYLKVLEQFHKTVKTGDKELIAKEALSLFGSDEIYLLDAYDEEFIDVVKTELERLAPIEPVLAVTTDTDLAQAKELFNLLLITKNKLRDDNL